MAVELMKLALLATVLFGGAWLLVKFCKLLWQMLDDIAASFSDAKQQPAMPVELKTCDACGSGPWHIEWDPDCRTRQSRNFYCPNCTGAD